MQWQDDAGTEVYARIGVMGDKKGIFVAHLYDLEGNPFQAFEIDTEHDVLTIGGKHYKLIENVE